ncbi:MAG: maleylacetoacetate isomerase, partial [Aquabacterium sp.]|nr:maleylacetoacetate isomerase [Aquabacterium sp.]
MKLYGYFRSSASCRVRIALNLKGLDAEHVPVHLVNNGGEQLSENFRALNPEALVPALMDTDAGQQIVLSQSLAIMEYLEERYPTPALLPDNAADRAYVRSLGLSIACEIHPLNNLRVLKYMTTTLGLSDEQKNAWYQHWCISGLAALEQRLASDKRTGDFCFGHTPTLADCCLVPQIFNAQRFNC